MGSGLPVRGNPALGLIAGTLAFFGGFAAVALFNVTARTIAPKLNLSIVEIGWLVAIPTLTGSLLRIPFGALVDKIGGRRVILTQLGIALVGMAGLVATLNAIESGSLLSPLLAYALLMLFGAVAGTGISVFSSGIAYVSYWFPRARQGFALGAYAGFGNTAPGIFTAVLPIALASLGLINSYVVWAGILAAMLVVFAAIGHDPYYFQLARRMDRERAIAEAKKLGQELFPTGSLAESLKISARVWRTWLLVVMYFTSFGGFLALTSWLPTYWGNYLGLSTAMAGLLSGVVYSLLASLVRVLGGWLSDRAGGERMALASYVIMAAGSLVVATSASFTQSVAGVLIMAVGMGIANAAVFKLVPKYVPEAVGGATGWVGGLGATGGLVLPPVMAYIVAAMGIPGYAAGFYVFTALAVASLAMSYILYSHGGR
ncbi:MAG: MFS transporter [Thermoproteus sp.]